MKAIEKTKAQKAVDKIQSGSFDELDVDGLFMRLRAYSHGDIFREFADLVAHNDLRDRGLTNTYLEALYLSFRYFLDYVSPKLALDISQPFPLYVKKLMKYQVDKADRDVLQERFSVTPTRLKSRIDSLFSEDKKSRTAWLAKGTVGQNTLGALQYVMGFIKVDPIVNQSLLIEQLIFVLRKNQLNIDEAAIRREAPRITLAAMILLHDARFNFGGHKSGYCRISCEKSAISWNVRYIDDHGKEVEHAEEFGCLQILGHVVLENDGKELTICFPVMSTDLKADEWCDASLFAFEQLSEHTPGYVMKVAKLDSALCLGSNFKLCKVDDDRPSE